VTKTNGEIKLKYFDFADDSGKFNERDDYVGGFGFVDTLKIVPDFANFTKINQVGSLLPNETSVPVIVFFRNSSVINSGIAELTHLGATVNNDNIINIVTSVPADLPASVLDYVSNKYAVAIFRDSPVYPSSLDVDKKINATKVWPNFKGNHVTIAVLDMGIDSDHPEFSGATIVGCNNTMPSTDHDTCNDLGGHGTHVAGIALARSSTDDPNDPLRGVAPKASLMVIQMMGPDVGSGNAATAGKAIDWAVRNGTDVINMSFGEGTPGSNCDESGSVYRPYVIEAAQKGQGIPMIAASGNHNFTSIPACLRYVIAVGAVDDTGHLLSYTNPTDHSKNMDSGRGKAMEDHGLVAPGVNVLSTWPGGSSNVDSGTSMAAPAVAGTVALMLDKAHHTSTLLTPRAIEEILFRTACRTDSCIKPGMSTMSNEQFGHGLLNASAAVNLVGNTLFDLRETHMIMPSGVGDITIGNSADIPVIVLDSSNQAVTSGTVIYDDNRSGGTFLKDGVCTLTIDHQCKAEYKPASNGPITVSSLYIGDDAHDSTYGSVTVHVHSPVVPEFPSGLLIVMLVTFTTIVLFSKLRKFGKIFT
jgi:subtilisin family serine protease